MDLPDRVKYWLNEAEHDCFFIVGPEGGPTERIGAIKPFLMGNSLPFRAMLKTSELAEKGDIRVEDVEPDTFKNFLKCIYGVGSSLIPKLTFEECAKLLYVTEKYLVSDLTSEIINQIEKENKFSLKDIYMALSHPICCQEGILSSKISKFLKYDFDEITNNDNFLELGKASIIWILEQESLNVKEIQIWEAILRWAKHKTNSNDGKVLRTYIFDCLKHFRFLTMEYTEFWAGVVPRGVLLEEEVNDICRALVSGNPCTIEHLCKNRSNRFDLELVSKNITSSFTQNRNCAIFLCSFNSPRVLKVSWSYHCSKTYHWAGHLWNLEVWRTTDDQDYLGVYLRCEGLRSNWNCSADVEVVLINQDEKPDRKHNFTCIFNPQRKLLGCKQVIAWSVLLNPQSGFFKDNTIYLMTKIKLKTH